MPKVNCVLAAVLAALLCAVAVPPAGAQDRSAPRDWSKWDSVQRLVGKAVIESGGGIDRSEVNNEEHNAFHDQVTVEFELQRVRPDGVWGGTTIWEAVRIHVAGQCSSSRSSESNTSRQHYEANGSYSQVLTYLGDLQLSLDHATGEFEISTPMNVDPYPVQVTSSYWTSGTDRTDRESRTESQSSIPSVAFRGQADRDIGVLLATLNTDVREEDGSGGTGPPDGSPSSRIGTTSRSS